MKIKHIIESDSSLSVTIKRNSGAPWMIHLYDFCRTLELQGFIGVVEAIEIKGTIYEGSLKEQAEDYLIFNDYEE